MTLFLFISQLCITLFLWSSNQGQRQWPNLDNSPTLNQSVWPTAQWTLIIYETWIICLSLQSWNYEGMQSGPSPINTHGMNTVILVEEIWCSYEKYGFTIFLYMLTISTFWEENGDIYTALRFTSCSRS